MKIKTDFVTNSSSVSFVVMGMCIDADKIPDNIFKEIQETKNISLDEIRSEFTYFLEIISKNTDLSYSYNGIYDSDTIMVGIRYTKMKEEETLKDFKQRAKDQIQNVLGINSEPIHIEKCWENR